MNFCTQTDIKTSVSYLLRIQPLVYSKLVYHSVINVIYCLHETRPQVRYFRNHLSELFKWSCYSGEIKYQKAILCIFYVFSDSANIKKCTELIFVLNVEFQSRFAAHELDLNCLNLLFPSMPIQHQTPCTWNWLNSNATVSWKEIFVRYLWFSPTNCTILRILTM